MPFDKDKFIAEYHSLSNLYNRVKEIIILGEYIDPDGEFVIAPMNEFRNALDHLMRISDHPDKMDEEFQKATDHIYRAGYDSYEIIAMITLDKTNTALKDYSTEAICNVFPAYYQRIRPALLSIQEEIANVRTHKTLDPASGLDGFERYALRTKELSEYHKAVIVQIPDISKEHDRLKAKARKAFIKDKATNFLIGFIVMLFSVTLTLVAKHYYDMSKNPINSKAENK